MQLTPAYGAEPVLVAEPLPADPATPLRRQRARLAELLQGLDEAAWSAPSRCAGWEVRDVVAHLVTTNGFWTWSIDAGLAGAPSTVLATFDPVATPAQLAAADRGTPLAELLERFRTSNHELGAALDRVGERWDVLAEAPPGHLAVALVAQHALWDAWIHERDIALPLGLEPPVEPDEARAVLRYAAALSPTFAATRGSGRVGDLEVRTTDPTARVAVAIGPRVVVHDGPVAADAVVITGDTVAVIEALSHRGPFPEPPAPGDRWVLAGLAEVFDVG